MIDITKEDIKMLAADHWRVNPSSISIKLIQTKDLCSGDNYLYYPIKIYRNNLYGTFDDFEVLMPDGVVVTHSFDVGVHGLVVPPSYFLADTLFNSLLVKSVVSSGACTDLYILAYKLMLI